jgi:hypothetical protein
MRFLAIIKSFNLNELGVGLNESTLFLQKEFVMSKKLKNEKIIEIEDDELMILYNQLSGKKPINENGDYEKFVLKGVVRRVFRKIEGTDFYEDSLE